jgi:hypothetical protein
LDTLASGVFSQDSSDAVKNPVFVLTVDDFDLNPKRCLDVLRLLRMISVPRLYTLALGDLEVAKHVIGFNFAREILGPYSTLAGSPLEPWLTHVSAEITSLTSAALRKLLPPDQRVALQPMSVREALLYKPTTDSKTLAETLLDLPLTLEPMLRAAQSLGDFIGLQRSSPTELPRRFGYSGVRAFAAAPRQIVDLWHQAARHASTQNTSQSTIELLAVIARAALGDDPGLPARLRDVAVGAISFDLGEWTLDTESLSAGRSVGHGRRFYHDATMRVHVRRFRGWRWTVVDASSDPLRPLGDHAAGCLTLLHDLLIHTEGAGLVGASLTPRPENLSVCATTYEPFGDPALSIGWPLPSWDSFLWMDMFLDRWNTVFDAVQGLDGVESVHFDLAYSTIVYYWMDTTHRTLLAIASATKSNDERHVGWVSADDPLWLTVLTELEELQAFIGRPGNLARDVENWLVFLPLLFTPELGAPVDFAARITANLPLVVRRIWLDDSNSFRVRTTRAGIRGRLRAMGFQPEQYGLDRSAFPADLSSLNPTPEEVDTWFRAELTRRRTHGPGRAGGADSDAREPRT